MQASELQSTREQLAQSNDAHQGAKESLEKSLRDLK